MFAIPTDPKDAKALRDFYTNVRTQMCSLGDQLGEPWKSHYDQIKAQYDELLTKLGVSDQVPAALDANSQLSALYSMLVSASSLSNLLSSQMLALKQTSATQLNSAVETALAAKLAAGEFIAKEALPAKVQEAIAAATTAGEIVPREQHTQLCSAAKTTGIEEGRATVLAETKAAEEKKALIETRKAALQTAGLPVPEKDLEKLLGGTAEEFEAGKTKVQGRRTALKTKSAYHSAFDRFLWLSDPEFAAFEVLAEDMKKTAGPEPFQQRTPPAAAPAATNFAA